MKPPVLAGLVITHHYIATFSLPTEAVDACFFTRVRDILFLFTTKHTRKDYFDKELPKFQAHLNKKCVVIRDSFNVESMRSPADKITERSF